MFTLPSLLQRCSWLLPLVTFSVFAFAAEPSTGRPPEKPATTPAPTATLAQLAFLTGTWRGTSTSGTIAEELISTPEGGVMLSTGREFKDGRCVFFDLVTFTEKNGAITLVPHPNGKRSPSTFPLVSLDTTAQRARFENLAHDFPKTFTYELVAPDRLRITLTGDQKGKPYTETFDLRRSP
jgi:hypothetical protein